ncbi:multiple sugar transport system substrate-binding protein [Chryseomicrobium aureum]|uniref:ABC transporter substrate-binding protein n=1 Tax=Chryseomicrobium aureum TaxID=1441723 RepID=UPI00195D2673|nr:ABC transporter substrate-binding protein [Chryseomicrobium aureum]MBM7707095.1 multiple sugar transport system substrate-binding protein [Chryseomicrobium aureum]
MNKLLKRSFVTMSLAALLVGCSNSNAEKSSQSTGSSKGEPIEIEFLHIHGGKQGEALDKIIENYHASQDEVRVKPIYVEGAYEGVVERLQSLAATDQLPEITQAGFTYTEYMLENMPIVPVQDYIDEEKYDTSDYFPQMLDLAKDDDGTIKGLPFAVSNPVVYYNKEIFEKTGINAEESLKTFEDVRKVAKELTKNDVNGVYFNYGITGNWLFQAMVETLGGQMIADDQKSVTFNKEEGVQALQYWVDLMNTDKSMPNINDQQAVQAFSSGKLAMYVSTPASFASMQSQSDFEVGLIPFPTDGEHSRKVPAGGNNMFILETTEEEQDAAWDFMKFTTSPESTAIVAEEMGYMAVRKSAVEDSNLLGSYYKETPAAYVPYTQIEDMVPWHNFPGKGGSQIYKIVQDNVESALNDQKTAEEAVNEAAEEANALLK